MVAAGGPALMAAHGREVTYTPKGGSPAVITGIFDPAADVTVYADESRGVKGMGTLVVYADADEGVVAPARGDTCAIEGHAGTWYVEALKREAGLWTLALVQYTVAEKTYPGRFVER